MRRVLASLLFLLLTSCATVQLNREFQIQQYWVSAQQDLAVRTNGRSFLVPYSVFQWVWYDRVFRCGGQYSLGCFEVSTEHPPRISVMVQASAIAIQHEACHAILFSLGDPQHACYCHDLYGAGIGCSGTDMK